eukprot:2857006-Prymnesium_polylepis.1
MLIFYGFIADARIWALRVESFSVIAWVIAVRSGADVALAPQPPLPAPPRWPDLGRPRLSPRAVSAPRLPYRRRRTGRRCNVPR